MIPSFTGVEISSIVVTPHSLRVGLGNGWQLEGECGCSLVRTGQPSIGVDLSQPSSVERLPELREALSDLVGRDLAQMLVTEQGHLGLVLVGVQLVLVPHPDFESWTLVGPAGERAVCRPAGEVVMWLTPDETSEAADV